MTSWLSKQKKQTLLELSNEAGLKQCVWQDCDYGATLTNTREEDTRKDEIIENLDDHLQKNATRLSRNPAFETYFGTRRTPAKARSSSAAAVLALVHRQIFLTRSAVRRKAALLLRLKQLYQRRAR